MKHSEKIISLLAIISLILIIVILPLKFYLFNENFYSFEFKKNNIQVEDKELIIRNLLGFFSGDEALNYFPENERSHLKDVQNLLKGFFNILNWSIILFITSLIALFFINKKDFIDTKIRILFFGGLGTFALLALLFLAALNFNSTFMIFHKLFFPQGNYLFAWDSLIISLFPEVFFQDFFLRLILSSLVLSLLVMAPQFIKNKFFK